MDPLLTTLLIGLGVLLAGLIALGALGRAIYRNPRGDFETGAAFVIARVYTKLVHRLRVRGEENIPEGDSPGPLIIVANHTAGVDPVLVQVRCPFMIRWMMASNMRLPALDWFWSWFEVLFVDSSAHGAASLRVALRTLRDGGVVGIFPEGAIERPPGKLMPFRPGVGVLIKKARARVLPVVIDGTPQVDPAWASLWKSSASVVHFQEVIDYSDTTLTPAEIAADLHKRFLAYTGWQANEAGNTEDDVAGYTYGRPVASA